MMLQGSICLFLSDYRVVAIARRYEIECRRALLQGFREDEEGPVFGSGCVRDRSVTRSVQRGEVLLPAVELPGEHGEFGASRDDGEGLLQLACLIVEVTRMMNEAASHYLKGGYTVVALAVVVPSGRDA